MIRAKVVPYEESTKTDTSTASERDLATPSPTPTLSNASSVGSYEPVQRQASTGRMKRFAGRLASVAGGISGKGKSFLAQFSSNSSVGNEEGDMERLEEYIKEAEKDIQEGPEDPFRKMIIGIVEHWSVELFMMILTVYALYGADMNQIYGSKDFDPAFGFISLAAMFLFFLEMVLTCIAKDGYTWSTYFWLDFIAAISLLGDVPYFNQEVIGNSFAAARAGRASKAGTRAARIVRVIRLIRMTRLIRLMKRMRGQGEVEDEINNEKGKEEENASAIANRLSEYTTAKIIIGLLFMLLAMMIISPGDEDTTWPDAAKQLDDTFKIFETYSHLNPTECNDQCLVSLRESAVFDFVEVHSSTECKEGTCCDGTDILSIVYGSYQFEVTCNGVPTIPNLFREEELRSAETYEETYGNVTVIVDQKDIRDDESLSSILQTSFIIVLLIIMMLSFQASYGKVNKDVVDPLVILTSEMNKVSVLEFDETAMIPSEVTEVRSIQRTFLQMKNSLMSFALFAPRDVVVDMLSSGKEAVLSVQEQPVTVFFSHIDNFEELNEKTQSKKDLLYMLSKYFDVVTDAIRETDGTLLDFIGDMVLAIWNAPHPVENHAAKALEACVLMREHINESPSLLDHNGEPIFEVSCGVNCGTAFVGNIGASVRMKYTVIGDPVNLASRLGGLNSRYHTFCVASENIMNSPGVKENFLLTNLDCVTVKGKSVGVRVYDLIGRKISATLKESQVCEKYNEAMKLYYARNFKKAAEYFSEIAEFDDYTAAKILAKRCKKFIADPPPADWDGSEKITQKHFH